MSSDPLLSRTIGNYQIVDRLGKGGMATVYRARQVNMQRDVAIKIMSADLAQDPQFVARFEREAQVIAHLEHPRILPVHDFGHEGELFYLVMRLIEGDTLYQRLLDDALPVDVAARFVAQIAEALDYAHAEGVIHRDLKPNNILIDAWDNLYLMDFGLAKMVASSSNLTETGAVLGTPAYMAPEQWRGAPVDARTDVYALGVILYEMVAGETPFETDTPYSLMYKHLNDPPPPLRDRLPDLPEAAERVILKALAKDMAGRYQSAGDLARAFVSAVEGEEDGAPAGAPAEAPPAEEPVPPPERIVPPPPSRMAAPSAPPIPVPDKLKRSPHAGESPAKREHPTPTSAWRQAIDAVESVIEAGVERVAESVPVHVERDVLVPGGGMPVASRAHNQMHALLEPGEQLVGVLDVRGTTDWQTWKNLLVGGLALNILGGILSSGLLSTLGVVAWLYILVQSIRTWKGHIGRYYLGFTPRRVLLLPRDAEGTPDLRRAQWAGWTVVDRLRLSDRYVLLDVSGGKGRGIHLGALLLAEGEGGLGDQLNWLPDSPITALIDAQGFEIRNM